MILYKGVTEEPRGQGESNMSHVFTVPDEDYARLEERARQRGATPEELFQGWLRSITAEPASNVDESQLLEAQARWIAANPGLTPPTIAELREHPLLRAAGIFASGAPGWGERHDAIIADEALDAHADE